MPHEHFHNITASDHLVTGSAHTIIGVNSSGASLNYYVLSANSNTTVVKSGTSILLSAVGAVPVGGVIAWMKNFPNTPNLPFEYVECNGQTLSDAASVYNGATIMNLNGSGGNIQRFLRGNTSSGATGGTETHSHAVSSQSSAADTVGLGSTGSFLTDVSTVDAATLPSFFETLWILRTK